MNSNLTQKMMIIFISSCLATIPITTAAKSFTSIKIIKTAHSRSCLSYQILPNPCVYMYLSCFLFWCGIRFTVRDRIRHRLPDLVVSSYKKPGDNPWTEIRTTEGIIAKKVMDSLLVKSFDNVRFDGAGSENSHITLGQNMTKKSLRFNEVNVIGSPAARVIRNTMRYMVPSIFGRPYLCKSSTRAFYPYLMSELDAIAWRKAEINTLDTSTDLVRNGTTHIGSLSLHNPSGNTWGTLHPRIGFVFQTEPAKSAAVAAQRAIDIVSKPNQLPHVYSSFTNKNYHIKKPVWQMITPKESSSCEAFGSADALWAKNKNTEDGDYAWNYWKQYECCKPGPGILLNP